MTRMALVETVTGKVINVIELEPNSDWQLPIGHEIWDAEDGGIGDTWDGVKFGIE